MLVYLFLLLASVAYCGRDFYAILGVERSASAKEIKKAYRAASLRWHPDKDGSAEAAEKFTDVSQAYDVLSNEETKRIYDTSGEEGVAEAARRGGGGGGGGGGFGDPFDMFSSFFGGGGGRGGQQRRSSGGRQQLAPVVVQLPVSLVDLYEGRMLHLEHERQGLCPHCHGSGAKSPDHVQTCPKCKGQGHYMTTRRLGPGFVQQMQTQCEKCGGKGKIVKESCPVCGGSKVAHGTHEESVVVLEAGMPDGHEIVLAGEGDEHPDYAPADIIFKVVTTPHRHFRRSGNDLHLRLRISLLQALVGFKRTIKHLDDHPVVLEKATVTKPGEVLRINGEGMPVHNFPSEKGDLFVTIEVVFPTEVSPQQAEEFRRLLADEGEQKDEL